MRCMMENRHGKLHKQCGVFEKTIETYFDKIRYVEDENDESDSLAQRLAYVSMKVQELTLDFKSINHAMSDDDIERVKDKLLSIKSNLDFIYQEIEYAQKGLCDLIEYILECIDK